MKNNKIVNFCFLIFMLVSVLTNFAVLTTKDYEPDYRYFTNTIIISVYVLSILLNMALLVMIIRFSFFQNNSIKERQRNFIFSNISLLILLIWFELIYSSIWYYGFGNHQNGLIANNWGIVGSIIFSTYLIFYLYKRLTAKLILFVSILVVHVILYLILSPTNILKL